MPLSYFLFWNIDSYYPVRSRANRERLRSWLCSGHIQSKDLVPVPCRQQHRLDALLEAKRTNQVIDGDQGIQKGKRPQPEQPAHPVRYKQDLRLQQKRIPHPAQALTIPAIQIIG